jgi:hypothetical protein
MLISPTGHIQLKGPSACAGKANASSGQNFVTNEPYYFGPILPEHDLGGKLVCELEKHGMIDLKSLLQETPWCNRILVLILGLGDLIFLPQKVWDTC